MMVEVAKWIVVMFGLFIILVGLAMLINPQQVQTILRKFASTNLINYTEITIRMIIGIAFILYSDLCKFPELFKIMGWFLFSTALLLYCVPRTLHHKFSNRSADILKPMYFRFIFPFAFLFGGLILYIVNWN